MAWTPPSVKSKYRIWSHQKKAFGQPPFLKKKNSYAIQLVFGLSESDSVGEKLLKYRQAVLAESAVTRQPQCYGLSEIWSIQPASSLSA